jgi:hypothetical protein
MIPEAPAMHTPAVAVATESSGANSRARGSLSHGKAARKRSDSSGRNAHTRGTDTSAAAADENAAASEQTAETTAETTQRNQAQPARIAKAANAAEPEEQKQAAQATAPKPAVANGGVPRTASESELLFGARKALPGDAELALRLLTEHAARFPKGQLVPEREVLAIESLRSLGRTQEAEARLQRFQARYPNSLHLQRLKR